LQDGIEQRQQNGDEKSLNNGTIFMKCYLVQMVNENGLEAVTETFRILLNEATVLLLILFDLTHKIPEVLDFQMTVII